MNDTSTKDGISRKHSKRVFTLDDYDVVCEYLKEREFSKTINFNLSSRPDSYHEIDSDVVEPSWIEITCFFFCAVGVSIGWSTVLASLVYFSDLYGKSSFLYLQLAVYLPTFPTAILQSIFDKGFDARYGMASTFDFRAAVNFIILTVCVACIPISSVKQQLWLLLLLTGIMGLFSGFSYGTFYQLISMINTRGTLQATFALGYQGASIIVFVLQQAWSCLGDPTLRNLEGFYASVAVFEFMALICYLYLRCYSPLVMKALEIDKKDDNNNPVEASNKTHTVTDELSQSLLISAEINSPPDSPKQDQELAFSAMACKLWPVMLSLGLTIFSNMFLFPFYTFIRSSNDNPSLPQYLFYIKLFSDSLGRPATVCCKFINTPTRLLVVSCVRFLFIPFFFIYLLTDIIPLNDIGLCIAMGLFAFTAGFVNTVSYQLAPRVVEGNGAMVANIINIVFHSSLFVALGLSLLVKFESNLNDES